MRTEAPEESPTIVAPPPKGPSRRQRRKEVRTGRRADKKADRRAAERVGLAPGQSRFVHRILPRSVIGIVTLLLAGAIGAAFGSTVLFAYYQNRTDKLEKKFDAFTNGFEDRYKAALTGIDKERDAAKTEVQQEIAPIRELRASKATLASLISQTQESVYLVETQDAFGQPKVGSAFVVTADSDKSYLVTSLDVVKAATQKPGPAITLRKGDDQIPATLWTWDDNRDLALLIVNKPNLPRLHWAGADETPQYGERLFVLAGSGSAGAAITQGFVADVSAAGIEHDAAVTGPFAGGPVINSKGDLLGTATPAYAPLGFTSDRITFSPPIRAVCEKILKCPAGSSDAGTAGAKR